jgi:hypothetical protein
LLITGNEEQTARLLAEAIAQSRFIFLSRVAHMTPLDGPSGGESSRVELLSP